MMRADDDLDQPDPFDDWPTFGDMIAFWIMVGLLLGLSIAIVFGMVGFLYQLLWV